VIVERQQLRRPATHIEQSAGVQAVVGDGQLGLQKVDQGDPPILMNLAARSRDVRERR
jgi:hypothetical protein